MYGFALDVIHSVRARHQAEKRKQQEPFHIKRLGMPPSLAMNLGTINNDRSFHESPQKAGCEGWLYPEQQQKLCHFKPDTATVHAQWVAIRT